MNRKLVAVSIILIMAVSLTPKNEKASHCCDIKYGVMEKVVSYYRHKVAKPSIGNPPDYFNWMDYNGKDWTTPVKYQGNCGSCWDFAAVSALESVINIEEGIPNLNPDLSEQYILSCLLLEVAREEVHI